MWAAPGNDGPPDSAQGVRVRHTPVLSGGREVAYQVDRPPPGGVGWPGMRSLPTWGTIKGGPMHRRFASLKRPLTLTLPEDEHRAMRGCDESRSPHRSPLQRRCRGSASHRRIRAVDGRAYAARPSCRSPEWSTCPRATHTHAQRAAGRQTSRAGTSPCRERRRQRLTAQPQRPEDQRAGPRPNRARSGQSSLPLVFHHGSVRPRCSDFRCEFAASCPPPLQHFPRALTLRLSQAA